MSEGAYWAVLTAPILESNEVSDGAKLFYAQVSRRTNRLGYCWASNRTLSEELGVCGRTITRYVAELEAAGFVTTEQVGVSDRKRRHERRIRLAVPFPFDLAKNGEIKSSEALDVDKNVHLNVDKNGDINVDKNVYPIKVINKSNKNNPLNPPQGVSERTEEKVCVWNEARFLKFWQFYRDIFCAKDHSRAGERAAAAAAWDKLKPDAKTIDKLGVKLNAIMKTQQWRDGYGIKMASTFLNGVRLRKIDLDELPEASPAAATSRSSAPVREEDEWL